MTEPTEADLAALDQALDALARRRHVNGDPALDALAGFAAAIDTRVLPLMADRPPLRQRKARKVRKGHRHPASRPHPSGRPSLRRRLAALPAVLTLAFLIGVPLSIFPNTPLHPIHRMIFQDGTLSPAENARLSLVSANQALDKASSGSGDTREADLKLARAHLAHARRQLALVADAATRAQLDATLSNLEQRASKLDDGKGGRDAGDGRGPGPSGQDGGERGQTGSGWPSSPAGGPEPWHSR